MRMGEGSFMEVRGRFMCVCALLFIVRAAIFSLLMYDVVDGKGGGAMEGHTCVFLRVY